jgi:hypothetical protein
MLSFGKLLQLQFLIGALGAIVLLPILFLWDYDGGGLSEIVGIVFSPIMVGVAFALHGLVSFPLLKFVVTKWNLDFAGVRRDDRRQG